MNFRTKKYASEYRSGTSGVSTLITSTLTYKTVLPRDNHAKGESDQIYRDEYCDYQHRTPRAINIAMHSLVKPYQKRLVENRIS